MKNLLVLPFLYYLRFFAVLQLKKISLFQKLKGDKLVTIGVTASAGKTTTVKTIYTALFPFFKVKIHNKPSETGLPLDILNIHLHSFSLKQWLKVFILSPLKLITDWQTYQIFIAEMGIDAPFWPKNMDFLLSILNPDIALFLNVNPVHAQNFNKPSLKLALKAIASEKSKLTNSFKPGKLSILNIDDFFVKTTIKTKNIVKTIGSKNSDIQILSVDNSTSGYSVKFLFQNKNYSINLKNQIQPYSFTTSLASALLIARHLSLDIDKVIKSIELSFHNEPGRSSLFKGIKNSTIIDSSYNSSLQATIEMLAILSSFSTKKIAVLGDMRELGPQTKICHRKLFWQAIKSADLIIGVGPDTQKYFKTSSTVHTFQFWWQALDFLKNQIKAGETILVKGSQNTIYLEELVKSLLRDKSDSSNLCRQSAYWLNLKQKFKSQFLIDQL